MDKKTIRESINYNLDWRYTVKISKVREDIANLVKLGATHIDIDSYEEYGDLYTKIEAICERLETDKEFSNRINFIKRNEELIKQKELKTLKELKLKYDK